MARAQRALGCEKIRSKEMLNKSDVLPFEEKIWHKNSLHRQSVP